MCLILLARITEERSRVGTLVLEHDIEQGAMHVETAIPAQPTFVINEPQLAELIYKETDTRAGGADHFSQRFLTDLSQSPSEAYFPCQSGPITAVPSPIASHWN